MGGTMEERVKTGVKGLDNLIEGGFVKSSVNLVTGAPGTGKSIFGCQFIHQGLANGETAMFLTLEEGMARVKKIMNLHGMSPDKYIDGGKLFVFDLGIAMQAGGGSGTVEPTTFQQLAELINSILMLGATRCVVDSISPLLANYETTNHYRRDLARFCRFLQDNNLTCILIADKSQGSLEAARPEEYICDSVLHLDLDREGDNLKRDFEVRKMRFTNFNSTAHTYAIGMSGLDVF